MRELLGANRLELEDYFGSIEQPRYRAHQLLKWLHARGVRDFEQMTDFPRSLREQLSREAQIASIEMKEEQIATDGTTKWLLRLNDQNSIETVFIPEDDRGTLCISSQVGCALNCSFCATGRQGFNRNLSAAEIIGQVWFAVRRLSQKNGEHDRHITNVVFMGMGEPLLNVDAVVSAIDILLDDFGYGLSKRRVTVSTSGLVPAMLELKARTPAALAVSLHAPNDLLRNELVPINKKYPLKELMPACRDYFPAESGRVVVFEYVMLAGVNDSLTHAAELHRLLQFPCKVNLIPFNPFSGTEYTCSSRDTILQFQQYLQKKGILTTIRKTRGQKIAAACGQLAGQVLDRTRRQHGRLVPIPVQIQRFQGGTPLPPDSDRIS